MTDWGIVNRLTDNHPMGLAWAAGPFRPGEEAAMSRTKPAAERRADLLAAGQALFVAKGIAATSLEDITNGAGVSKGLFYVYFRSKEDLVLALQGQFSQQLAERIGQAADTQTDWPAKLDASVQASFECYRQFHDLHEVLFRHSGHEGVDPDHEPTHALLAQVLGGLLEDGVKAGAFDVEDAQTTAVLFYVTMHAFDPNFHGRHPPTDAQLIRATQQLFRRAAGVTELPPEGR
jgi:TetR/AcrR family transcriptional regulator, transcriptional repressor for nem operon